VRIRNWCGFGGKIDWDSEYPNGTIGILWDEKDINRDERIMRDLRDNGPVIVLLNSEDPHFLHYVSGIYNPSYCSTTTTHAVILVGWGTENGVNYWIAKNSWGTNWGESGYFRIARGKNLCGINKWYYYPILRNTNFINKSLWW